MLVENFKYTLFFLCSCLLVGKMVAWQFTLRALARRRLATELRTIFALFLICDCNGAVH